jgi:hypothetical protein
MPDTIIADSKPTEIKPAKIPEAVKGASLDDSEFLSGLQAAIDKDAGKAPEPPAKKEATPEKPDAAAAKADDEVKRPDTKKPIDDIPPDVLGKKKEVAKEEPPPSEADRQKFLEEQTKGMTPKAADRFKAIEKRANDAELKYREAQKQAAEVDALKKKLAEAEQKVSTAPDTTEVDRLKKQLGEYEALIKQTNLANDPAFKATYDAPIAAGITGAKSLVPTDVAEEVEALLSVPSSKKRNERLIEIGSQLDDIQRAEFFDHIKDVNKWSNAKAKELANWKENNVHREELEVKRRQANMDHQRQVEEAAWSSGMQRVSSPDTGLIMFRKANGSDEWNAKVDQRIASTREMLQQGIKPDALVEMAAKAVAADELQQLFLSQRMLVEKLQEEIERLSGAQPGLEDGGDGDSNLEDKDDFITASTRGLVKAGVLK